MAKKEKKRTRKEWHEDTIWRRNFEIKTEKLIYAVDEKRKQQEKPKKKMNKFELTGLLKTI